MKLLNFKKKNKKIEKTDAPVTTEPVEKDEIDQVIETTFNQKDMFGRKIKLQTPILMLDDFMITWRRKLLNRSKSLFMVYTAIIVILSIVILVMSSSLFLSLFTGVLGTFFVIGLYLLMMTKTQYISAISNSLQIPSFNRLIKNAKIAQRDGASTISDIADRKTFKPYNSYIVMYLSSKNANDIDSFIKYSETVPRRLKNNLSRVLKNKYIKFANLIYNTDSIRAKRPTISESKSEEASPNMVGVNLASIARDGKVKRGGRAKNVQEAIRELELMKESKTFVKGAKFKETAPWYLKLFTNEQLDAMLEMNMSPAKMARWQTTRIGKALIVPIAGTIGLIAAMSLTDVMPALKVVSNPFYLAIPWLIGFGIYKFQGREITGALKSWRFKRKMAFAQFTQVVVPYLYLMKAHGGSLFEVFQNVSERMEDTNDKALVVKLQREMRNAPESDIPFINFAKSFTDDPNAVVFMTAINRSSQSKADNDVIEDLAQRAQNQLIEMVQQVRSVKESRMAILPTYVTIIGMLINLIMVMSAMMNQMASAMG